MRFFLFLSYNGKNYCGWQAQKNGIAVQTVIEEKLETLLRTPVALTGCGRTDTGVHASYYVAHFDTEAPLAADKDVFIYKLNSMLPPDIAIKDLIQVHDEANARFDAVSRTYKYYISGVKDPFNNNFHLYLAGKKFHEIDIEKMNQACAILFKHDDFSAFAKTGSVTKTNLCKIIEARADSDGQMIVFTISADRFLRNMVRAITGTLLAVATGKISLEDFEGIILSRKRSRAGVSVPARGLFLEHVEYIFYK